MKAWKDRGSHALPPPSLPVQGHGGPGAVPQPGAHVLQVRVRCVAVTDGGGGATKVAHAPRQRAAACMRRMRTRRATHHACTRARPQPCAACPHARCRGASAAVIVYDITSPESFTRAKAWVRELQRQGNPDMIMALAGGGAGLLREQAPPHGAHARARLSRCARPHSPAPPGNKADLEEQRAVQADEAQAYAAENGLYFVETSAKTAANVNELFVDIASKLPKEDPAARPPQAGIALDTQPTAVAGRRGTCC